MRGDRASEVHYFFKLKCAYWTVYLYAARGVHYCWGPLLLSPRFNATCDVQLTLPLGFKARVSSFTINLLNKLLTAAALLLRQRYVMTFCIWAG